MSAQETAALGVEGGNLYDKYATSNPIEQRLVGGFLRSVTELAERSGARNAHEVGCGEAELAIRLAASGLDVRGSDVSTDAIEEALTRIRASGQAVDVKVAGIADLEPARDSAELVVCCEVLEHLADPNEALEILAELADPWLLASVPREPIWRALNMARGKYIGRAGNTPGHLNHWSARSFLAFLSERFEVVEVRRPVPWSMALCKVRP